MIRPSGFFGAAVPAALGFAMIASASAQADEGKAAYDKNCLRCHTVAEGVSLSERRPAAERAAHLEKFLARHHARNATERAAIIAFLMEQMEAGQTPR